VQGKILIAYYSQGGNTRRIAELIQKETAGDFYEIIPEESYKSLYLGGGTRIKKERETGILPELRTSIPDIKDYDLIFLGTPNWGNSLSHPVLAFLKQCDLERKIIAPFCTHGGGGAGHIEQDIRSECLLAQVYPIFEIYGNGGSDAERKLKKWIGEILK